MMYGSPEMLVLLGLLSTTVVYGSRVTDCPCVSPWTCGTTSYGSHALDIATFGLIPSCPVLGTVRCCPRDGPEKMSKYRNLIEQLSESSVDSNNLDVECDCVRQGICLPHFVTVNSDCHEFEELCCIPNSDVDAAVELFDELPDSDVNAAVELFIDELVDNFDNENTDAFPSLDPTIHDDGMNVNGNIIISHSKPPELEDDTEDHAVPCVPGLMCAKLYGFHPLDIARFGALPHCSRRGLVRCVELKAPSSSQPHLFTHEEGYHDAYILPCVLVNKCDTIYGFDPLDVAKFGALPHCAKHGFARCIQVKDTTGSTTNTSPSVILSEMQAESSSAPPTVISDIQAQPSLTSLIISDIQDQSFSAVNYQTDENGDQDLYSSDMKDVGDQGNSNDDERAAIVDLNLIKVSMDDVVLDDELTEFTPIALEGNNVISEGVNLKILIPSEFIGTDIHRLIRNHLALRAGSNSIPVSTEMRQKYDQHSINDRINSVDVITKVIKSNELIKHHNVQHHRKFVEPGNKQDQSRQDIR